MTPLVKNGQTVAVVDRTEKINTAQDLLDLFVSASYTHGSSGLIVYRESLSEDFFDLKTRVAGELLQKCSNYRFRFAVVGDFSGFNSKSLNDFIYECNKGSLVFFKDDLDSAAGALTS